jgi:hypothetical protein
MVRARVFASHEAGVFVRERGGRLYVWLKTVNRAWGRLKVSTSAPQKNADWDRIDAGGFELLVDAELPSAETIHVELRRWPWKRLRVSGFATGVASDGDAALLLWDSGGGGGNGGGGGGNGGG